MRLRLTYWIAAFSAPLAISVAACNSSTESDDTALKTEIANVRIDEATIAGGNPHAVIHPVWWTATIYDGPAAYEKSLQLFTRPQRQVFAMLWYKEEVDNGGHDQFYSNSTGIVWRDALEGFEAAEMPEVAANLRESANRLGGSPPLDRRERQALLDSKSADFADLDDKFYELDEAVNIEDKLMAYIRSRPKDFYFSGQVKRLVLPKPR